MSRYLSPFIALILAGCSSTGTQPRGLTPADLLDREVDMFGVVADIPHRQYLGESGGGQTPTVYRWQAEYSQLERGSSDVLVSAEALQIAGLPVLDQGSQLDFVGGMYQNVRYRLAGTLDRLTISGYVDVRMRVQWQLYDAETGEMVFVGASNGFARGQNLGLTGIQPNALLHAFQNCLGDLLSQPEFAAAIAGASESG